MSAAGREPALRAQDVHKRFGRLEVLRGISLEVKPSEVMCLVGPSGSGKTTFLRAVNHLERIDAGRLWVDGELVGYRQDGDVLHELRESEVARKRAQIPAWVQSVASTFAEMSRERAALVSRLRSIAAMTNLETAP